jgi:preprotein translocase subunit SecG
VIYALYTIHVIVCLFLILVVLLQQGKGADLSVFGGGGTQTAFGARGAATLLHKLTVFSFVAFIFTTVGIGILKSGGSGASVMSDVVEEAAVEEEALPEPLPAAPETGLTEEPAAPEAGLTEEPGSPELSAPAEEPAAPAGDDGGSG